MFYTLISGLALILNLIVNRGAFQNVKVQEGVPMERQLPRIRYSVFVLVSSCYFLVDAAWGILDMYHEHEWVYRLLYVDTLCFFLFMILTMITWIRYVVAYIGKKGPRSNVLLYAVTGVFFVALIFLLINCFYPFIFYFDEHHAYVPLLGRHILLIVQIVLYFLNSAYMLFIASKSFGEQKVRYFAVGSACLSLEVFLILQVLSVSHPFYAMGLIIAICLVHSFVEMSEREEKRIYDSIARGLAEDYAAMYYINIETGEYQEYVTSEQYRNMNIPVSGKDFYTECEANVERFVYPEDLEIARGMYTKEVMMQHLEGRSTYSYKYRLLVEGAPHFFLFTLKLSNDGKHFILYEKDIEADIQAERERQEAQKQQITFAQIAEGLAANYDVIYYVDAQDSSYVSFETRNIYGHLSARKTGDDYYADSLVDIPRIVHPSDRELVQDFLGRDHLISMFSEKNSDSITYRIMAGEVVHYVRLTARKSGDGSHIIIGIENVDTEVQKEKEHMKALHTEKELARRDDLTGVKNKNAYHELEKSVQENIDNGLDYLTFSLVVCDANNLKQINDMEGHVAGDEYIKSSAKLLCNIFTHSPVFRVGGDEFVVFLRSNDFTNRDELMKQLRNQVEENLKTGKRPILASGMADFLPGYDTVVSEIFERADKEMYENKQKLKEEERSLAG